MSTLDVSVGAEMLNANIIYSGDLADTNTTEAVRNVTSFPCVLSLIV